MTTPAVLNEALQVLRHACDGYGLAAASIRFDNALLTYGPGDGAFLAADNGRTVAIPDAHVLAVTEPAA